MSESSKCDKVGQPFAYALLPASTLTGTIRWNLIEAGSTVYRTATYKILSIPLLQNKPRDYPACRGVVFSVPTFAS